MIRRYYDVLCDYCDCTINHYPDHKPSINIMRRDGVCCTSTKQFCSEVCYANYMHDKLERQYMNLKQNGKIH